LTLLIKEMKKEFTKEELNAIGNQLSCPKGDAGIFMGIKMNNTNISMTIETIKALKLTDGERLLELGHGNAGHLELIMNQANDINYQGLEISNTMLEEAQRINKHLEDDHSFVFSLYDGQKMPFINERFDKLMTVNTIYFWQNPKGFINEIYRVMKKGGIAILTFGDKDYLKNLPFINNKFTLYDTDAVKEIIDGSMFELEKITLKEEQIESKSGKLVLRKYSIVSMKK
jgi:ubiquinone/menaquinone biosynthesis C-methylase UbiE